MHNYFWNLPPLELFLKIKDALPHVFRKAYPVLDPKTPMLPTISLLRFHEIDALPLSFESRENKRQQKAVFGFSSLARLMLLGPKEFASFLKQPCEAASEPLATVRADQNVSVLLNTFAKTRFGFARVEDKKSVGALASLSDVLGLYRNGTITTNLVIKDVGSRILSMPGETLLKNALEEMFRKRYRRLFLSGSTEFISDRTIIGHIFSPAVLNAIIQEAKNVLETPISAIERMSAKKVPPNTSLKAAAGTLKTEKGGQCLVFDGMVVTPWDVVMKPWKARKLKFKSD